MARETLSTALKLVFGDEGGYVNAKTDAGGPTKHGVTHKTLAAYRGLPYVTDTEVKALTLDEAADIHSTGFWAQSGGDILPVGLDYVVFNSGIMSGPARAVRVLQRVLGLTEDGNVGPRTKAAVEAYEGGVLKLIRDYCDAYMAFLRGIKGKQGFVANGRGWTIRITGKDPKGQWPDKPGVVGNALKLAAGAQPSSPPKPIDEPVGNASAIPMPPNAWLKPETLAQGAAAAGGLSFLATGSGPVQWAVGVALVVAAGVGAYFVIRRIRRTVV